MSREIDLDAIEAKRIEEVGSANQFPFVFQGRTWQCLDPLLHDDETKLELQALDDEDLDGFIEIYLGTEQAEEFVEAGGGSSHITKAINLWLEMNTDETGAGPTRRTKFSNRTQRRSKQR
ncbi:hypothetical protein ACT89R_01670 [Rhodococcus qingshengii]